MQFRPLFLTLVFVGSTAFRRFDQFEAGKIPEFAKCLVISTFKFLNVKSWNSNRVRIRVRVWEFK